MAEYEAQDRSEQQRVTPGSDDALFEVLTQPLRREIHLHCYRMLGTLDDADDALQETLLRAWRNLDRFEPRAPFRAWCYRIATNVCLTMLAQRARRGEVTMSSEPEKGRSRDDAPEALQPYPDGLLDEFSQALPGPEATAIQRESVELAFVAAVQHLPPRQRAALLLRDVVGYSAIEAAEMLETSVAGANSALQRARVTLERERNAGRIARSHGSSGDANEQEIVRRLSDAWHASDIPSIVALLTEDALLTMPPQPERYVGREAIGAFLASVPAGGKLDRFRLVPTRANRQPAVALYEGVGDGPPTHYQAHAIVVVAIAGGEIASLTRFADPGLFTRFSLPMSLSVDPVTS